MKHLKYLALATPILLASTSLQAADFDGKGFFIGGGYFHQEVKDCNFCDDIDGLTLDLGYDFNRFFGIDGQISYGIPLDEWRDDDDEWGDDNDWSEFSLTAGINLGYDFNTGWFKTYGKLGYTRSYILDSDGEEGDNWSGIVKGVGVRFTPGGEQEGFYIKVEMNRIDYSEKQWEWEENKLSLLFGGKF